MAMYCLLTPERSFTVRVGRVENCIEEETEFAKQATNDQSREWRIFDLIDLFGDLISYHD